MAVSQCACQLYMLTKIFPSYIDRITKSIWLKTESVLHTIWNHNQVYDLSAFVIKVWCVDSGFKFQYYMYHSLFKLRSHTLYLNYNKLHIPSIGESLFTIFAPLA